MTDIVPWEDVQTPYGFSISDKGLGYESKTKAFKIIAPPFAFIGGFSSLENDEQAYVLQYLSPGNTIKIREVKGASLTSREIESWVAFGIGITPTNKAILIQYLVEQRMLIPIKTVYKGVGWLNDDCFGANQMVTLSNLNGTLNNEAYDLKQTGSKQNWFSMWHTISDSPAWQLAFAIGLTAPLLKPLAVQYPDLSTLIFSISGDSSIGKSTMLEFCLSMAGAPHPLKKGSLFQSWSSTSVALSLRLNGNHGIPVGLDELSRYRGHDITEVLYNLSAGTEKARGTKQANLRKQATWQTTIISTGEHGLLDDAGTVENQGLRMRVIEIDALPWTKNSEEAEQIKKVCNQNYGWLYTDFVQSMLSNLEQVKTNFTSQIDYVREKMPSSNYRDRISVSFATVMAAATLANDTWPEVGIDVDGVLDLLIKHTTSTWSTDLGDRVYWKLLDYLKSNQNSLILEGHSKTAPNHVIGTLSMDEKTHRMYANIYQLEFKRIVESELNAQSERVVLAALKKKQVLRSEAGRVTRRHGKERKTVVSVVIPENEEKDFTQKHYFDDNGADELVGCHELMEVFDSEEATRANKNVYPKTLDV